MKFRHEDALERPMPARQPAKYEDVSFIDCDVRLARVSQVDAHYRTTLGDLGVFVDDRFYALGVEGEDVDCVHHATRLDRFGYARCAKCHGHLFCAQWIADGLYREDTERWAIAQAQEMESRLPKLRLV